MNQISLTRILLSAWYGFCAFLLIAITVMCTACGGEDSSKDEFRLIMTKIDGTSESLYKYDTANDCIGAGSYRVAVYPEKYIGFSCKEI